MVVKSVLINGGMGKNICAIPALEKYSESCDRLNVITGHPDLFVGNEKFRIYHPDHSYLWEDVISQGEFTVPEPYFIESYWRQEIHMIDGYNILLNGEVIRGDDGNLPIGNVMIYPDEFLDAKIFIDNLLTNSGKKKFVLCQPYGQAAMKKADVILDPTARSIREGDLRYIVDNLDPDVYVFLVGQIDLINLEIFETKNRIGTAQMTLRQIMALTAVANYIIGIDSLLMHLGWPLRKNGTILLGATYKENACYPQYNVLQRDGFPKEIMPWQMPTKQIGARNYGAMDFSKEELDVTINQINKDLEG